MVVVVFLKKKDLDLKIKDLVIDIIYIAWWLVCFEDKKSSQDTQKNKKKQSNQMVVVMRLKKWIKSLEAGQGKKV